MTSTDTENNEVNEIESQDENQEVEVNQTISLTETKKVLLTLEESLAFDTDNFVWLVGEYVGRSLLGNFFLQGETIYFRQISIPCLEEDLYTPGFCLYRDGGFIYIERELAKACIKSRRDNKNKLVPCDSKAIQIWNNVLPKNKKDFLVIL